MAEPNTSTGPAWIRSLEDAHQALTEVTFILESIPRPPVHLEPVAREVEAGWEALYAAYDRTDEPNAALGRAIEHARVALSLLGGETDAGAPLVVLAREGLQETKAAFERAREALPVAGWQPLPPAPEFRASLNEPLLRELRRPRLTPRIVVAPSPPPEVTATPRPLPTPKTFGELAAVVAELKERAKKPSPPALTATPGAPANADPTKAGAPETKPLRPGFAPDPWPALTETEFIQARAREAFEEVAMIGMQRTPLLDDPWRGMLAFELRMLQNIDVLLALGPEALVSLEELTRRSPIKDPCRVFGLGMVLGSLQGRDTLGAAERYFLQEELKDPAYPRAFVTALKLMPHPEVEALCRRWLRDPSVNRRAWAVEVLTHRNALSAAALHEACQDDRAVLQVALPYFALTRSADLRETLDRAMRLVDQAPDDRDLFLSVSTALGVAGHPAALPFAEMRLDGPVGDIAAVQLAIQGTEREALELVRRVEQEPRPGWITGASWGGANRAIPALMAILSGADDGAKVAAAYGLERLTAAGFWEMVTVPPEEIADLDLPEPELGEPPTPLAQVIGHPVDPSTAGSPDFIERPTTDPAPWIQHFRDYNQQLTANVRLRRGQPYSPLVTLAELDTARCTVRERRSLQRELVLRTGGFVPFDPDDLVAAQCRSLEAWQPIARNASVAPGTWHRPARSGAR